MASQSSKVLVASSIGITLSAFFAGGNLALTYVALPSLLLQPSPSADAESANSPNNTTSNSSPKPATPSSHLSRQWQAIYDLGKKLGPAVAIGSGAAFTYTALQLPKSLVVQRRLNIAAAILAVSIAPFTFIAMKRTNDELIRRANLATQGVEEDDNVYAKNGKGVDAYRTDDLIKWWGTLNTMRASIPLIGIGAAVTALVW